MYICLASSVSVSYPLFRSSPLSACLPLYSCVWLRKGTTPPFMLGKVRAPHKIVN